MASMPAIERVRKAARVLVVDDSPINIQVIVHFLKRLGCNPDFATSGEDALRKQMDGPWDLVLMDCQMPSLDGFDTTRRWRQRERLTTRTLVVALTANAMPGDRERCLDAGMDDYVTKPLSLQSLKERLARWLAPSAETPGAGGGTAAHEAASQLPVDCRRLAEFIRDLGGTTGDVPELIAEAVTPFADLVEASLRSIDPSLGVRAVADLVPSAVQVGALPLARLLDEVATSGGAEVAVLAALAEASRLRQWLRSDLAAPAVVDCLG